jgi:hypothetical protein
MDLVFKNKTLAIRILSLPPGQIRSRSICLCLRQAIANAEAFAVPMASNRRGIWQGGLIVEKEYKGIFLLSLYPPATKVRASLNTSPLKWTFVSSPHFSCGAVDAKN